MYYTMQTKLSEKAIEQDSLSHVETFTSKILHPHLHDTQYV